MRQEISSLKAAKSEDSFASVQSSEPSTASTDTKDNTNELSNHANVSSRTTEGNESGLISQVLKQVKSICPYVITFLYSSSVLSSFMICQLKPKTVLQASEIESLKQENLRLAEEKDGLEIHSQKLAEESSYAKELASAAAVELKNLAEEVTRLSYENAKLSADLAAAKEQIASVSRSNIHNDTKRCDHENGILVEELQKELVASCQREAVLEDTLSQKDRRESELLKIIDDAKCREHELETELASMWVLVSKIKKESSQEDVFEFKAKQNGVHPSKSDSGRLASEMQSSENGSWDGLSTIEEARAAYNFERRRCKELESIVSRLKVIIIVLSCTNFPAGKMINLLLRYKISLLELSLPCLEPLDRMC